MATMVRVWIKHGGRFHWVWRLEIGGIESTFFSDEIVEKELVVVSWVGSMLVERDVRYG